MPQVINKKGFQEHIPVGKGSVYTQLLQASSNTNKRACKINETATNRLNKATKVLEKNAKFMEIQYERIIKRINKNLLELNAYQKVLKEDFKADDITASLLHKSKLKNKAELERRAYETRIFYSGFSISNLKRVVDRKITEIDPMTMKSENRKALIRELKWQNRPKIIGKDLILPDFMQSKRPHHKLPQVQIITKSARQKTLLNSKIETN